MNWTLAIMLATILFSSCESRNAQGIVAGGVVGRPVDDGVVISGLVTPTMLDMVATALDDQDRQIMMQVNPITVDKIDRGAPLTIHDIVKLQEAGISDETIIRYVRDTKTVYELSQAQIRRLQAAGVSQRLINYLVETGR